MGFVGRMTGRGSAIRAAAVMRGVDLEDFRGGGIVAVCFAGCSSLHKH